LSRGSSFDAFFLGRHDECQTATSAIQSISLVLQSSDVAATSFDGYLGRTPFLHTGVTAICVEGVAMVTPAQSRSPAARDDRTQVGKRDRSGHGRIHFNARGLWKGLFGRESDWPHLLLAPIIALVVFNSSIVLLGQGPDLGWATSEGNARLASVVVLLCSIYLWLCCTCAAWLVFHFVPRTRFDLPTKRKRYGALIWTVARLGGPLPGLQGDLDPRGEGGNIARKPPWDAGTQKSPLSSGLFFIWICLV
jgi:hypothetical protein